MFESIDLYCERLGPAFMAEPLNALSNLARLQSDPPLPEIPTPEPGGG